MKKSLLQIAKEIPARSYKKSRPTGESVELAIAWAYDEVNLKQVNQAMGTKDNSTGIYKLAIALREAVRTGRLKVVK